MLRQKNAEYLLDTLVEDYTITNDDGSKYDMVNIKLRIPFKSGDYQEYNLKLGYNERNNLRTALKNYGKDK